MCTPVVGMNRFPQIIDFYISLKLFIYLFMVKTNCLLKFCKVTKGIDLKLKDIWFHFIVNKVQWMLHSIFISLILRRSVVIWDPRYNRSFKHDFYVWPLIMYTWLFCFSAFVSPFIGACTYIAVSSTVISFVFVGSNFGGVLFVCCLISVVWRKNSISWSDKSFISCYCLRSVCNINCSGDISGCPWKQRKFGKHEH